MYHSNDGTLISFLTANPTLTFISSQDGKMLNGYDDYNDFRVILPESMLQRRDEHYLADVILEKLLQRQHLLVFDRVTRECQEPCHKCSWTWIVIDL